MWFDDRRDAGRRLASVLVDAAAEDAVVLAVPRGGVPVGHEIARALALPLDVLVVRKMTAPLQPELGVGAIAEGGATYVDHDACELLGIFDEQIDEITARGLLDVEARRGRLRGPRPPRRLRDRTVILVDDGAQSGSSLRAAITAVRRQRPHKVILALPIAPAALVEELRPLVDDMVCLQAPIRLLAIGVWYRDFTPVDDEEVIAMLADSPHDRLDAGAASAPALVEDLVHVAAADAYLEGDLTIPDGATALVLLAHAGAGNRNSAHCRVVTHALSEAGYATLHLDLFTARERKTDAVLVRLRFEIELLAERIVAGFDRLCHDVRTAGLDVGCFGTGTGAAAALMAAAERPDLVRAVVSHGGRPDLAGVALGMVRAPTLLVVAGDDPVLLDLNRRALAELHVDKRLAAVPGAHGHDEPIALERVAELARRWFERYLITPEDSRAIDDIHEQPAAV